MNLNEAPLTKAPLQYRPDIDGLRAVAVLSVIAFHTGMFRLSGGYVGVDVFFVISGYLISSIVFAEISNGTFSIAAFYERRIRRIFPALFAMLVILSLFSILFLLPVQLIDFGKALFATSVSGSNFYLWTQSGYFDHRNSNPLLHTWSLAVEEQFYILFPIFLVFVRRLFPRHLKASVVVLFLVSLVSSAVVVWFSPDTAFYMPYTRAWELLAGTLISLGMFPRIQSLWTRNAATLLGLGMILASVRMYDTNTLFPGPSAIIPCLGSVLIIGAGISGESLIFSVLAWRPIVFIGLISYSLYLWHWPVIMVYRMGVVDLSAWFERSFAGKFPPDRFDHVVEVLLSFLLAILSWRFVERPFRKGRLRLAGRQLFAAAAAVMFACFVFSGVAIWSGGLKNRFSPDAQRMASFLAKEQLSADEKEQRLGTCFIDATTGMKSHNFEPCLRQESTKKNVLLLGDSHAAAIWPALNELMPNVNVMQVNVTACPPTIQHGKPDLCRSTMDYVYQHYLPTHTLNALLLESDWDSGSFTGLDETLGWAAAHKVPVLVFGCVPEYDAPLPQLLAYSIAWHDPNLVSEHRLAKDGALEGRLRNLVEDKWHFQFVSLYDALCDGSHCIEFADAKTGIPLMDDSHHLNRYGAHFVIQRVLDQGELEFTPEKLAASN